MFIYYGHYHCCTHQDFVGLYLIFILFAHISSSISTSNLGLAIRYTLVVV